MDPLVGRMRGFQRRSVKLRARREQWFRLFFAGESSDRSLRDIQGNRENA
jgi:hypothetical protein